MAYILSKLRQASRVNIWSANTGSVAGSGSGSTNYTATYISSGTQ